jgi:hypothetical protein
VFLTFGVCDAQKVVSDAKKLLSDGPVGVKDFLVSVIRKVPYMKGAISQLQALAVFVELGFVKKDEDLQFWLPTTIRDKAGCRVYLSRVAPKADIHTFCRAVSKKTGEPAITVENMLCKLYFM